MTDADMLELVKQHLAMLGRMAQVAKVREVGTKKWIGSRKVIAAECLAAINKINDHQRATATPDDDGDVVMIDEFSCDCCGELVPADQIRTVTAYGIETSACDACRGVAERCRDSRPAKICPVFRAITGV